MTFQLQDAIQAGIEDYMTNVHTCIPGKIESYDPAIKKASILPLIKRKFATDEELNYPVVSNVPVQFPGGKAAVISYPISIGDAGLLVFSERSMEEYLSGAVAEASQEDPRRFSLNDGVFIPGVFPFGEPGKAGDNENIQLLNDKGIIHLNGDSKSMVTFEDLNVALTSFVNSLNTQLTTGFALVPFPWVSVPIDISSSQSTQVKSGG